MADDKRDNHGSSGGPAPSSGRPKRPGPTIELEASHVSTSSPASPSPASDVKPDDRKAGNDKPSTPVSPQPKADSGKPASGPAAPDTAEKPSSGPAAASNPAPQPQPAERRSLAGPVLAGALSGAVMAGAVMIAAISAGFPQQTVVPQAEPAPAEVRLADLEALAARLAKLEQRPNPEPAATAPAAAPDTAATDARFAALDQRIGELQNDLAKAHDAATRAGAAADTLKAAMPAPTPVVDLSAVNARMAEIERSAAAMRSEVSRNSARDDLPLRRVLAATLLDVAVRQSEPYADMLALTRPLSTNADALKPLEPFAASGVPNRGTMIRDLQALLPKLSPSAPVPDNASVIDRLQASAMRLVRIQRTDTATSDGHAVLTDRIANALRRGDISAARTELNALPVADRVHVQSWIDRFDARQAALAASHRFATNAMTALIPPAR